MFYSPYFSELFPPFYFDIKPVKNVMDSKGGYPYNHNPDFPII